MRGYNLCCGDCKGVLFSGRARFNVDINHPVGFATVTLVCVECNGEIDMTVTNIPEGDIIEEGGHA